MVLPVEKCVDAQLKESFLFPTGLRRFSRLVINDSNFARWRNVEAIYVTMKVDFLRDIAFQMEFSICRIEGIWLFKSEVIC